jgi:hypothetical protein
MDCRVEPGNDGYVFFPFPAVIFIALLTCIEQPAMSFCDIDDFADVISCMAAVLVSPSGIFITAASALAMPSSVQPAAFDFAKAGAEIMAMATTAAQAIRVIMLVPPMNCGGIADQEETFDRNLGSGFGTRG